MVNLTYRDYENFIIAYCANSKKYLIIEDIYADFFRKIIIEKRSIANTEKCIAEEYGVPTNVVHNDLLQFNNEIDEALSGASNTLLGPDSDNLQMQKLIFDRMCELMIPFSATIELTDFCNLQCKHCYRGDKKQSYWTEKTFVDVLDALVSLGTMNLTITGGEPFSHPLICWFLDQIKRRGFVLSIQTNALLLNDSIISALKENIVSDVSISLYSTVEFEHDTITQLPGSMRETMANIERLLDNKIPVSLNCPIMSFNKNAMVGMCNFADEHGIKVKFALKIIPSQNRDAHIEDYNVFNKGFILSSMQNPIIKLYQNELAAIRKSRPHIRYCQTGFRSITFDAQGNMLICNAYRKNCGSLKYKSVKELWEQSEELNKWRNEISLVNKKCSICPAYSYCEPCPAHAYTIFGKDNMIDEITCKFGNAFYSADKEYTERTVR